MLATSVNWAEPSGPDTSKPVSNSPMRALLHWNAFFSVQCQLFTLVPSTRSSTIQRGSPSPHLAIVTGEAGGARSRISQQEREGERKLDVQPEMRRRWRAEVTQR